MLVRPSTVDEPDEVGVVINDAAAACRGVIATDRWHDPGMAPDELRGDRERAMLVGTWKAASWVVRFCQHHGFRLMTADETRVLPQRSWTVPERQIDESVVPAGARWTR